MYVLHTPPKLCVVKYTVNNAPRLFMFLKLGTCFLKKEIRAQLGENKLAPLLASRETQILCALRKIVKSDY